MMVGFTGGGQTADQVQLVGNHQSHALHVFARAPGRKEEKEEKKERKDKTSFRKKTR